MTDEELLLSLLVQCSARVVSGVDVIGTALLVAPGLALTCRHVIEAIPEGTPGKCKIWVDDDAGKPVELDFPFIADLPKDPDKMADLALLRLKALDPRQPCAYLA